MFLSFFKGTKCGMERKRRNNKLGSIYNFMLPKLPKAHGISCAVSTPNSTEVDLDKENRGHVGGSQSLQPPGEAGASARSSARQL